MRKYLILITLFLYLGHVTAQLTYSKEIEQQIKQVENSLAGRVIINGKADNIVDRMAYFHVNGISIAVVKNYQVIWARGYGWANEKEKRPVTIETLFKPGSISKSLNAVGVLKLVQDNKLDLFKDINDYLKSWKFPYDSVSKGKKITMAQLLSHTAGLSVYGGFPGYDAKSKIPTIPEILDGMAPANTPPVRSLFEPGLKFQYSGGGIIISQLIIADVTQQPYEKFMYDQVLKPMGMTHSFYRAAPPATDKLTQLASGYTKDGVEVEATFRHYPEQAPLGLWTTPTDLCNYIAEIQLACQGKSSKVLNQKMARLHLTPYIDSDAALGTFVQERNGEKYFFHDAGNEGFRGLYFASVEGGNGVAIFVNSDEGTIILELLNSVASVYDWKGFDKAVNVNTKAIPDSMAQKYVGVYLYDGNIAEVTNGKDGLFFWTQGQNCKMHFTTDKDFINIEFPSSKSFILDSSGTVTGYSRKLNGKEFPPAKKFTRIDTLRTNKDQINAFAWHLLETKRFDEAIAYLNRGLALEPNDITAAVYLAHCFLFKNEYDKAITLYKGYFGAKKEDQASLKEMIKQDFESFQRNGFDRALVKKASGALGL